MRNSSAFRSAIVCLVTMLLVGGMVYTVLDRWSLPASAAVSSALPTDDEQAITTVVSETDYTVFLPLVCRDSGPHFSRLGFGSISWDSIRFPDIRKLSAGWYQLFSTHPAPERPMGIEHIQVVRLHQKTSCWPQRTRDRVSCPYQDGYWITSPAGGIPAIQDTARANPGALWFIGNEMDRRDWDYGGGGGQDEMLPEMYARAYYDIYHAIKGADDTAKVAIGGMVQATPLRLAYLDTVWKTYQARYGSPMPVDVWNVHNFIMKERCDDYGADVPPGYNGCYGEIYPDGQHNNLKIFDQQIRAFRLWMKEHGEQDKPLIVSEYGIVYRHAGMEDFYVVRDFMLATFDYFLNTTDGELGYPADDYRLVQRWAWYSLDDPYINRYSYLIDPNTARLTALGEAYAGYALDHADLP